MMTAVKTAFDFVDVLHSSFMSAFIAVTDLTFEPPLHNLVVIPLRLVFPLVPLVGEAWQLVEFKAPCDAALAWLLNTSSVSSLSLPSFLPLLSMSKIPIHTSSQWKKTS